MAEGCPRDCTPSRHRRSATSRCCGIAVLSDDSPAVSKHRSLWVWHIGCDVMPSGRCAIDGVCTRSPTTPLTVCNTASMLQQGGCPPSGFCMSASQAEDSSARR
jgi:hypothetical protein